MNSYEEYYSQKPVSELLELLLHHKLDLHPLDKDWYESLITYLGSLNLEGKPGALYGKILASDVNQLNFMKAGLVNALKEIREAEEQDNPLVINPAFIIAAGKRVKNLVFLILGMFVLSLAAAIVLTGPFDYSTRGNFGGFCLIAGIAVQLIMLITLYSAGNALEKSVTRKKKTS